MTPLSVALLNLGKEEVPRGSNWGPDVQLYLSSVGILKANPWCMAFIYYCVDQYAYYNNILNPLVKTGSVIYQWEHVNPKLKVSHPQTGDIFIRDHGHGRGHTGFVESTLGTIIYTIEGNSNSDGSNEGIAVLKHKRSTSDSKILGYIRIPLIS